MSLGADLQRAWTTPGVTPETKKRIIRTLIDEIVVRVEDNALALVIRWHGGDHSPLKVRKNRSGQHRWSADGRDCRPRARAGTPDAGQGDRLSAQSRRQNDGAWQRLDTITRVQPA